MTLYEAPCGDDLIKFRMLGEYRSATLLEMRQWFHCAPPRVDYLGYGPDEEAEEDPTLARDTFWFRITDQHLLGTAPDPRVKAIIHPALRFICRALSFSIFARGESNLRPGHDD